MRLHAALGALTLPIDPDSISLSNYSIFFHRRIVIVRGKGEGTGGMGVK